MTKPRIVVTRRLPEPVHVRLAADYDAVLNPEDLPYDTDALCIAATGAAGLVPCPTDRLDAAAIARLPDSVRIIATFSVGYDHIDVPAAAERGIVVGNTPGVLTDATADVALLLMLAAARRAGEGERMVRAGAWGGWTPTQLLGSHLGARRLGILGMGRIGRAVAARARAFGMEIHYHNRNRLDPKAEAEIGATYHADADALLAVSDVLSLHCPATAETTGFLNAQRIALMPPGAIVVNTARGAVVDDEALIDALAGGRLAAAGLDVYANEPALHPGYMELENAVLLPHLGSATLETRVAMGMLVCDNLDAFFAGRPLPAPVVP